MHSRGAADRTDPPNRAGPALPSTACRLPAMSLPARPRRLLLLAAALFAAAPAARAQNLIPNGDFDHQQGALFGWITDYAWTGNTKIAGNKDRVSVEDGAARLQSPGSQGAKMECVPIPFEPGFRYTAEFQVKGGPYRIYFAGYKWKPGIRPHDNPELGELRMIYKSKALAQQSRATDNEKIELPGVELSPQAKAALKPVRFLTLYVWMLGDGSIDGVRITRTADARMKF